LIDLVTSANPKSFDAETLARFRSWLHSFMAKFGQNAAGELWINTGQAPPQPSEKHVAQLLAVADLRTITRFLEQLFGEGHHQPQGYFWFTAVALNRIHGITVDQRKEATQKLVDVKRQAKEARRGKVDAGELPDHQFTQETMFSAVAGVKNLR
jgi:hypothetical protein